MAKGNPSFPSNLIFLFILSHFMLIISNSKPLNNTSSLPQELFSLELATRLSFDTKALTSASTDFGKLTRLIPAAVLHPSSLNDISTLIKFSYNHSTPFTIAAKGHGHSVRGQAMASNGIVIDMRSLNKYHTIGNNRINISRKSSLDNNPYVDAGGEQLWIDILHATLKYGLAPRSWTDYLSLTVGGTLSNAGISGQSFRTGPQISNVYEMDVITGKGDTVTCSKNINSELFYAVLGGLGQFGIITRARIALEPAPQRARWVRMLYYDFSDFTKDQEHLISINGDDDHHQGMIIKGLDYIEGSLMLDQVPANNWRSTFFSSADYPRIASLTAKHRVIYCLEGVKYYNSATEDVVDELDLLFKGLSYIPGFKFTKDISYLDFLNRVSNEELKAQSQGPVVTHPWLNLFLPKSQISDFNSGFFKGILINQTRTGPILVYPMNHNKWDDRMSAMIPDEDIFYTIGLLQASGLHDWEYLEDQNREVLQFCDKAGIKIKQYLPHYKTKSEWINHFGSKWDLFQERKAKFDPKAILSPGQRIFTSP